MPTDNSTAAPASSAPDTSAAPLSDDQIERQQIIDSINADLPSGATPLRYDANQDTIDAAEELAFQGRIDRLAYEIASHGGKYVPTQAQINAATPLARVRLKGKEKRGAIKSLVQKLSFQQTDIAAQRAALDAKEAQLVQLDAQYGALIDQRDNLASAIARAQQYQDAIQNSVGAINAQMPQTYLLDFVASSHFGTAVAAAIVDDYQKLLAAERAVADWEHIKAQLQVKLDVLNQQIVDFEKQYDL